MIAPADIAVLVPVKDLEQAKSRLSPLLALEERRELAWRLLERVLAELAAWDAGVRRVLVSNYAPAIERAQALGFAVIPEAEQISESTSVDAASAQLEAAGVRGVLRVPLDLPLFSAAALEPVLAEALAGRAAVLVPARDRMGTNALYRAPPTLFASHFGPDSLTLHTRAARAASGDVVEVEVPHLALDIDDPADVTELLRRDEPCPALAYLRSLDIAARLERMQRAPA